MATTSTITSILAILISISSLAVSFYNARRDRAHLKITAKFFPASEYGPDRIHTVMVNAGRRPIILRTIGGTDSQDRWSGVFLDHDKGGLRLGEHERYEHTFRKDDAIGNTPEVEDIFYDVLWVEDSLGVRHIVPNSRALLKQLWDA